MYVPIYLSRFSSTYLSISFPRSVRDTRSITKKSLTGLNSGFYFFSTGCNTRIEEPSLSYYLVIANSWIHTIPKGISFM